MSSRPATGSKSEVLPTTQHSQRTVPHVTRCTQLHDPDNYQECGHYRPNWTIVEDRPFTGEFALCIVPLGMMILSEGMSCR
jgi:hypothetical protein